MHIFRVIVVISLLFSSCSTGTQAISRKTESPNTYYVSPSGNDNSSGSMSAPFKTIQKAANIVKPGDTVVVKNGTYTDLDSDRRIVSLRRGGTSSAWVTFRAENKWGAVLDGQSNNAEYCWISASAGANYIRIEGFEMKDCVIAYLANLKEHDISLKGNYIHDTGRITVNDLYGRAAIFTGIGTANFTFDSNIFHSIGRLNPYTTPSAPESFCTTPPGYKFKGTVYSELNACYNHDHALYLEGKNNTIINNIFYDLKSGWAVMSGETGNTIVNNTFIGNNPGRLGQILIKKSGTTIHNNIFYNDRDCGIFTYLDTCGGTIKNNLFFPGMDIRCNTAGYPQKGTWTISGNILSQDPKLMSPSNNDFHLQEGSPAIDKGIATGAPAYDIDKNTRPQGSGYDIGAYEYFSVEGR